MAVTTVSMQQPGDELRDGGGLFSLVHFIAVFTGVATQRVGEDAADALLAALHRRAFKSLADVSSVAHECLVAARYSCTHNVCVTDAPGAADESVKELTEDVRVGGHENACEITLYRVSDE